MYNFFNNKSYTTIYYEQYVVTLFKVKYREEYFYI